MGADEYYVEQSADEIFSGPTHELVPSSYSSFHRLHWPHNSQNEEEEENVAPHRRNSLWSHRSDASAFASGEESEDEVGRFQFFSRDEISHAEGASTVIGDDDSVHESFLDSDVDSNAAFSSSGDEEPEGPPRASKSRFARSSSNRNRGYSDYVEERASFYEPQSSDELLLEDRETHHRPFLGVGDSDSVLSVPGSVLGVERSQDAHSHHHFEYKSHRIQQRYYIAEGDMRIVCAGYSSVPLKLAIYKLFCFVTCGLVYLWGRWFPRQKLRMVARATPLGRCDFVVIENQWGELDFVNVETHRYNNGLSTIFNLASRMHSLRNTICSSIRDPQILNQRLVGTLAHEDRAPHRTSTKIPSVPYLRILTYRYVRFLYNPVKDMFFTNTDWVSHAWESVDSASQGLDGETQEHREQVFGLNTLVIAEPTIIQLLVDEVLHPFYMFQVFSIILWTLDEYIYYAAAIFVISVISVAEALSETKKSTSRLAAIAHANTESEITVLRSGFWIEIPSEELVPGDVYELSKPALSMIPVDSILLSGDCIVNESILTGESVPVSKVAASDLGMKTLVSNGINTPEINRSVLYCGTKIIRVRKPASENEDFLPALALVVRTGFTTTKGVLIRSMMFPKPNGFRFYRDSFRYIGVMAMVALVGFSISAFNFVRLGMNTGLIVLRALDIITVVVPPALPATLTIGTNFSLQRLREKAIYCITPSRVNVAGRVNLVAFDKTGTLTDEGLDVLGVHLIHDKDNGRKKFGNLILSAEDLERESNDTGLLDALITCHELRNVDGIIMGDPLDVKMFEFTKWSLDEEKKRFISPGVSKPTRELKVYKQFEFVSRLRRMSVIASNGDNSSSGTRVLAKGAPEIMREICLPETIPMNFDEVLHQYTHRGYRVIACACRDMEDITDYDRNELEAGLTFAGLIIFENKLKPESRPIIETLSKAGIRTLMCTGDNLLTAVSVARECSILPPSSKATVFAGHFTEDHKLTWEGVDLPQLKLDSETLKPLVPLTGCSEDYVLAVTGDVFSHIVEQGTYEALDQMLLRGVVYARMSPDEKHELVTKLQRIDYTVCFCGDGANDCGALNEADVGISLSEAEASVAAPFTSRRFNISCVPDVLAEGRCALTTSFGCFKYMSMYSAIQFVTVTILYTYGSNIGDFQFLWIDLFLIVPIAAFMAWSGPAKRLSRSRPGAELVSLKVLMPLLSYMAITTIFQILAWRLCHQIPGYIAPVPGDNDVLKSTDNTTLFYISSLQYIMTGWFFCDGPPFRVKVAKNLLFLATILVTTGISLMFVFINPDSFLGDLMDLTPLTKSFEITILGMALLNFGAMELARRFVFAPLCLLARRVARPLGISEAAPRYKEIIAENLSQA
nr:Ypk9 [Starmerella bombicola]